MDVDASLFRSFVMGGFEGSSHRRADGQQLDLIGATRHDMFASTDFSLLAQSGIMTVRDAFRWHLIETAPGRYDWSSALPLIRAAREAGVQPIWDLCHYGMPHDLDIWSPSFVDRFAGFATAASRLLQEEGEMAPILCPMNEISYWAWAGGDQGLMYPAARHRGPALKRQLAQAAIAAIHAIRAIAPGARFVMAEPLIHVTTWPEATKSARTAAAAHRGAQFEAFDMVAGRLHPELGGTEACLDVVGVNFYPDNQFIRGGGTVPLGHQLYRPLRELLAEVHDRYDRPLLMTETGAEGGNGPGWLHYVMGEVRAALRDGVPLQGVCLYPVMDYPGWRNKRHCRVGLIEVDRAWRERTLDGVLHAQLQEEALLLRYALGSPQSPGLSFDITDRLAP